ncbi:MAG: hypothetical protein KH370_01705 [Collinsella intestinalis]|nr:hypothetical protein [Collinsella intestinalis]
MHYFLFEKQKEFVSLSFYHERKYDEMREDGRIFRFSSDGRVRTRRPCVNSAARELPLLYNGCSNYVGIGAGGMAGAHG